MNYFKIEVYKEGGIVQTFKFDKHYASGSYLSEVDVIIEIFESMFNARHYYRHSGISTLVIDLDNRLTFRGE
jgi:hypothetical protein